MGSSPHLGMGVLPSNGPLPPTVSPPYMTFCRSWRGVNPACIVFTKNFQKNFWENLEDIPPYTGTVYLLI